MFLSKIVKIFFIVCLFLLNLQAQTTSVRRTDSIRIKTVDTAFTRLSSIDSLRKYEASRETIIIHDTTLQTIHDTILMHDTLTSHDTVHSETNLFFFPEVKELKIQESFSFWKIVFSLLLILIGGWINWRVNKFYLRYHIIEKFKYGDFIKILFHIFLWLIISYLILFYIIVPSSFVMIVLGAALLLMIVLASNDFVKNVIGGIILLLDRPFTYGDWIKINDYYGKIRSKSFRSVEIITLDDSIINLPNQLFLQNAVENLNVVSKNKQVNITVKVPQSVDVIEAKKILFEVGTTSIFNSASKPTEVTFKGLSPEGMNEFNIKAFVFDAKYENELRTNILETINSILNDHFSQLSPPKS